MADSADGSIIIKRIKKGGGDHHGGAWKIAYADFVTAMMAFFLLLWLLNSVTEEQLQGISNYFAPASASRTTSGAGGILGGQVLGEPGSQQSSLSKPSIRLVLPPPRTGLGGEDVSETPTETDESQQGNSEQDAENGRDGDSTGESEAAEAEQEQFEQAQQQLRQALKDIPNAEVLARSLVVDDTPEGLRVQIVDQDGLSMFPSGSAEPLPRTIQLLELVMDVIKNMPQKIAVSGHTDSVPFTSRENYSNWELSADRANSARRVLEAKGLPEERLARVVGKSDTEPLIPEDPQNARNRRLSIVLLRGTNTEEETNEQRIDLERLLKEQSGAPLPH